MFGSPQCFFHRGRMRYVDFYRKRTVSPRTVDMGVELIYHDFDDETPESPFEDALVRLSDDATLDIACPYLGLDILQPVTDRAQTWRLVTDVQEWFRSHSGRRREPLRNREGRKPT